VTAADWLGSKFGCFALMLHSSDESGELSQWLYCDCSTINIVVKYHYGNDVALMITMDNNACRASSNMQP